MFNPFSQSTRNSVQSLLGIESFSKYGLSTTRGELLFYQVSPINISVLSKTSIEAKIRNLTHILSAIPDIEITCTDSSECFDSNQIYLTERIAEGNEPADPIVASKGQRVPRQYPDRDGNISAVRLHCAMQEHER